MKYTNHHGSISDIVWGEIRTKDTVVIYQWQTYQYMTERYQKKIHVIKTLFKYSL